MRFAVGYRPPVDEGESFPELVADYRDAVGEVYFAPPGAASGRPAFGLSDDGVDAGIAQRFCEDLRAIRRLGVKLDVLFNANCYGADAMGRGLERMVTHQLDQVARVAGAPEVVTTTSLAVAHVVRRLDAKIEIRASVNMRLGTLEAMGAVEDLFDSYYVQRDVQRDVEHVARVREWAKASGKGLCMLANSGCLAFCPGQTFHDNLVAHAQEIDPADAIADFVPYVCRRRLGSEEHRAAVLRATWVRPEDLHHYEGLVDVVKLATRAHPRPRLVLDAYARGRFHGNLLELLEPGHADLFAPGVMDNDAFPDDWFARTSTCGRRCEACGYCEQVLDAVLR